MEIVSGIVAAVVGLIGLITYWVKRRDDKHKKDITDAKEAFNDYKQAIEIKDDSAATLADMRLNRLLDKSKKR